MRGCVSAWVRGCAGVWVSALVRECVGVWVRGIGSQWESAARSAKVGLNGTMFRTLEVQCVYLLFCHNPQEDVN